jgi:hypothetical protein
VLISGDLGLDVDDAVKPTHPEVMSMQAGWSVA